MAEKRPNRPTQKKSEPEEEGVKEKLHTAYEKIKKDERVEKSMGVLWVHRLKFVYGALMLIGVILAFYYPQIGGAFVGLAVGMCFSGLITSRLKTLKEWFRDLEGYFKLAMFIGVSIYLLLTIPVYFITTWIGYGFMVLLAFGTKKS